MYTIIGRMAYKKRSTGFREPVRSAWQIEKDNKSKIAAIAKRMHISESFLMDEIIDRLELTDQGVPPWAPPLERDGELPIDPP